MFPGHLVRNQACLISPCCAHPELQSTPLLLWSAFCPKHFSFMFFLCRKNEKSCWKCGLAVTSLVIHFPLKNIKAVKVRMLNCSEIITGSN